MNNIEQPQILKPNSKDEKYKTAEERQKKINDTFKDNESEESKEQKLDSEDEECETVEEKQKEIDDMLKEIEDKENEEQEPSNEDRKYETVEERQKRINNIVEAQKSRFYKASEYMRKLYSDKFELLKIKDKSKEQELKKIEEKIQIVKERMKRIIKFKVRMTKYETVEENEEQELNNEDNKEKAIEKEKYIKDYDLIEFKKLNIKESELEEIDGFTELSEGQRFLVLDNFKQLILGRIQEEAGLEYEKDKAESNFVGRVWKGASKKYQIAKFEKTTAEKITKGGIDMHKKILEELIGGMIAFKTEVKEKNDKLEIQYVTGFKNLLPERQKQVDEFNELATEFSKIPYEWSLKRASEENKIKYREAKGRYEKAKITISWLKSNEEGKKESLLYLNDIDRRVTLNQFLNANPEVETQLKNIKNKSAFGKIWKDVITERGFCMVGGFLVRTASISTLGFLGAPLAAAEIGGFMARSRAEDALRQKEILARGSETLSEKLEKDENNDANNFRDSEILTKREIKHLDVVDKYDRKKYALLKKEKEKIHKAIDLKAKIALKEFDKKFDDLVDADYIHESIDFLIKELGEHRAKFVERQEKINIDAKKDGKPHVCAFNEKTDEEDYILKSLKFHIDDAHDKIKDGTVNFGSQDRRLCNQQKLITKMSEGIIKFQEFDHPLYFKNEKYNEELAVINECLSEQDKEMSKTQRKYLRSQIIKGATMSAAFATAGYAIRYFGESAGWWGNKGETQVQAQEGQAQEGQAPAQENHQDTEHINSPVAESLLINLGFEGTSYEVSESDIPFLKQLKEGSEKMREKGVPEKIIKDIINLFSDKYFSGKRFDLNNVNFVELAENSTKEEHSLLSGTGADIKFNAGKMEVLYGIGKNKEFKFLDQSLRRIVLDNMDLKKEETFNALKAAKVENILANLRELMNGNSVANAKAGDFKDIISFDKKTGELKITDYFPFKEKLNGLAANADKVINKESDALAYVNDTSQEKWQEMLNQKNGEGNEVKAEDFNDDRSVSAAEERINKRSSTELIQPPQQQPPQQQPPEPGPTGKEIIKKEIKKFNNLPLKEQWQKLQEISKNASKEADYEEKQNLNNEYTKCYQDNVLEYLVGNEEINENLANNILLITSNGKNFDMLQSLKTNPALYDEIKSFSGEPTKMNGIIKMFSGNIGDIEEGAKSVFGIKDGVKFVVNEKGLYKFKDVEKSIDIIFKIKDGHIKFGVDGPFLSNWKTKNPSLFNIKPVGELTKGNLSKLSGAILRIKSQFNYSKK